MSFERSKSLKGSFPTETYDAVKLTDDTDLTMDTDTHDSYENITGDENLEEEEKKTLIRLDTEIIITPEDEASLAVLTDWLVKNIEITQSLARTYGKCLVNTGIDSVRSLTRRVENDADFLPAIGIGNDDSEEIISVVNRLKEDMMIQTRMNRENTFVFDVSLIAEDSDRESHSGSSSVMLPEPERLQMSAYKDESDVADNNISGLGRKKSTQKTFSYRHVSSAIVNECREVCENLQAATLGKMDAAIVGVLTSIAISLPDRWDRQRAYAKVKLPVLVVECMKDMSHSIKVCERAMTVIALLCRHSEENKVSVSMENAKTMGLAGAGDVIVNALKEFSMETRVYASACDAVRGLCLLESNRSRLGDAGVCEALGRAMTMAKILSEPDLCCWILRALGHLANGHVGNRARLGGVGVCEAAITALQRHMSNMHVCVEVCWALRHIAPVDSNRNRIADAFGPECIVSVMKGYATSDVFVQEASKALVACVEDEHDAVIHRIVGAGCIPYFLKSLKKYPESESLARSVLHFFYFITCDVSLAQKFVSTDIYDILSTAFEQHASDEDLAKWGCYCVHNLLQVAHAGFLMSVSSKMRSAGLCEMVSSCVQRQAVSGVVSGVGSLAIGDLAIDKSNHARLSTSGACEAVVTSLKRHDQDPDVVFQTCYAIHYLSATENNIGWMGANGGCEAVTAALCKHTMTSVTATQSALRALGSLGYHDDGNLLRLHAAGACLAVVTAIKTYGHDAKVAEFGCRAVFNLCGENTNVSDLGARGACGLVVLTLQDHEQNASVVTEACLAMYGLAVKMKTDKVHNGNTRKLVTKGAIESVVNAMRRYVNDADVQRAGAMAMCSLGRLDEFRTRLGSAGAVNVILTAITSHSDDEQVVAKLATAVDVLATNNDVNRSKFAKADIVETLLSCLGKHERSAAVVGATVRALITMSTNEASKQKIRSESAVKLAVRAIRLHEKDHLVAKWGCSIIYTCATDNETRAKLGEAKACEAVISILQKHIVQAHSAGGHGHGHGHGHDGQHHSTDNEAAVASWGCRAIVGLSVLERNSVKFNNVETCTAVVDALKHHSENALVSEWACAALVTLAAFEPNRPRLGAAGGCEAITNVLSKMASKSEIVTKLACEAIFDLALNEGNRQLLGSVGACEPLTMALGMYLSNPSVTHLTCRAVAGVGRSYKGEGENASRFGAAGACEHLVVALKTHVFNTSLCEWACAAIASLAEDNQANQATFAAFVAPGGGVLRVAPLLVYTLKTHRSNVKVSAQAIFAVRSLCTGSTPAISYSGGGNEYIEAFGNILNSASVDMTDDDVQVAASTAAARIESSAPLTMPVQKQLSLAGIIPVCLKVLKTHRDINGVAQNCCWVIGHIVAPETTPLTNPAEEFSAVDDKDFMDINAVQVDSGDEGNSPRESTGSLNPITPRGARLPENNELYKCTQHWDLLQSTLQMNLMKPTLVKYVCEAISTFATHGKVFHESTCDAVMTAFLKYTDPQYDLVIESVLFAIGNLAESHEENRGRLAKQQVCQLIDQIFSKIPEGEHIFSGAFRAVQGLANDSPEMKTRFMKKSNFSIGMVRAMYDELESEAVSLHGCAAITALTQNEPDFQRKLSPACNFLADVLIEHQKSPLVVSEAFRAISSLSHADMTNRNKLGVADCCEWVPKVLGMYVTANFAKTYMDTMAVSSRTSFSVRTAFNAELNNLIHWGVRCIADLAANHPNNQAKLGANGACELLVTLIKNIRPVDSFLSADEQKVAKEESCKMAKWVCWALGNIVQLGKGSTMSIQDEGQFSVTKGLGGQAMIQAQKNVKNTARLAAAGAVDALLVMMLIYAHVDGEVAQWASRAMNNMGKSRGLKAQMIERGAVDTLRTLMHQYAHRNSHPSSPRGGNGRPGSPKGGRGRRMSVLSAPSGATCAAYEMIKIAIDTLTDAKTLDTYANGHESDT